MSVKSRCFEAFILNLYSFDMMVSERDLGSYFAKDNNAKVKSSGQKYKLNDSYLIRSASNITGETEIQLVQLEIKNR